MFSLDFGGEVLLVYVVVWVVVGVFVADAVAQFFVAAVVGVLEVWRDCGFCAFDGVHGSEDGVDCGVAFGGAGHVGDCLGPTEIQGEHFYELSEMGYEKKLKEYQTKIKSQS